MNRLVIAEKPSVGKAIAAVLGAHGREDGCFIGNGYIVSWCFGHLAELAAADTYDEKYGKWRCEDLPILPQPWRYSISEDKRRQFDLLREFMRSNEVSEIINACDAGREGELIFRTVYALSGCTKPMKRLWISSMEDEAIREGFENLHPGSEYDALYEAALCRSRADWLVGINATRLFSVLYHRTLNEISISREGGIAMQKYIIALYIRLSLEDSKYDSLSIENQRMILNEFALSMPEAENAGVREFVDNGYSGTNFERPAIQELLELVRANKVDCIIVKDLWCAPPFQHKHIPHLAENSY